MSDFSQRTNIMIFDTDWMDKRQRFIRSFWKFLFENHIKAGLMTSNPLTAMLAHVSCNTFAEARECNQYAKNIIDNSLILPQLSKQFYNRSESRLYMYIA